MASENYVHIIYRSILRCLHRYEDVCSCVFNDDTFDLYNEYTGSNSVRVEQAADKFVVLRILMSHAGTLKQYDNI